MRLRLYLLYIIVAGAPWLTSDEGFILMLMETRLILHISVLESLEDPKYIYRSFSLSLDIDPTPKNFWLENSLFDYESLKHALSAS